MDYKTEAQPKATAGGVPVFCAHDAIVAIEKLIPNPKNPNTHPDAQIQALGRIIRQTGWRAPITVSKRCLVQGREDEHVLPRQPS